MDGNISLDLSCSANYYIAYLGGIVREYYSVISIAWIVALLGNEVYSIRSQEFTRILIPSVGR